MTVASYLSDSVALFGRISPQPAPVLAAVAAVAVMALAGRLLLPRAEPAVAFGAGMGAMVLLGTMAGVAGIDVRLAVAVLAAAASVAALRGGRRLAGWAAGVLPIALLALPLLLLLSDRRGSEWDEFSHWLHAFRYLADNHALPGGPGVPVLDTCCAAYPYGWPMAGLGAMMLTGFSEAVPALLNVLLLVLFASLLVGAAEGGAGRRVGPAAAAALLAATAASPTFVHKLVFSAYADVPTAFLAAVLAVLGERMADDAEEGRARWALGFGLAGAALLGVKPGNAALFGCILGGSLLLSLRRQGWRGLVRAEWLLAVLPAMAASGLWRWHVDRHLAGQELGILPRDKWHVAQIPQILLGMLDVARNKGGHFGLGVVMVVLGLRGFVRDRGRLDRLCAMAGMAFLGYNLFLLVTYVAVFGEYEALHVASFWRYNTHLGLVLLLPAALLAGRALGRLRDRPAVRALGRLAVVLVLCGPVLAAVPIRFDHELSKPFLRQALRQAGTVIPAGARAVVVDPSGSGLSGVMAVYEWSGRVKVPMFLSAFSRDDTRAWLDDQPDDWAFVFSGQERLGLEPPDAAYVLRRENGQWSVAGRIGFPNGRRPIRWP